jgi:hypothetical protein
MFRPLTSRTILLAFSLLSLWFAWPVTNSCQAMARVEGDFGQLPLYFMENRGQVNPEVQYYTQGSGFAFGFTPKGPIFLLNPGAGQSKAAGEYPASGSAKKGSLASRPGGAEKAREARRQTVVRMTPVGMNQKAAIVPGELQEGKVNHFLGNDPQKWRTDIPTCRAVTYREAYPGIDLKFYGNGQQLEYDVIVRPGADFRQVRFHYSGVKSLRITPEGDLALKLPKGGVLVQKKPLVYQEIAGQRVAREGKFTIDRQVAKPTFGFEVAAYDSNYALVIDPVLVYSTYLGGSGFDAGTGIALDAAGNIYVTGTTQSTNFPLQNPYQDHRASIYNQVFVTKFNPQGNALIYSTYLGGADGVQGEGMGEQYCNALAVDKNGCAYVTGYTYSTNFPTKYPYQADHQGNQCIFVTKFNAQGNDLVYSTYLGQGGNNRAMSIAVDQNGNAYLAGQSEGDFPTTASAYQPVYGGGGGDAVVAKFNADGSDLMYATFLGGAEFDGGVAIAVDNSGNAYVTGYTTVNDSSNFPTTAGVTQPTPVGSLYSRDAFVTKLNADGSGLVYSTFLGGTTIYGGGNTYGHGIAVDAAGHAYVTGNTDATSNFPIKNAAQPTPGGGHYQNTDAFVTAYNPTATDYLFSTYLGGSTYDMGAAIAVFTNSGGNSYIHVTGETQSLNFPTKYPIQASLYLGQCDAFVSKVDVATGALVFSTYLGGTGLDHGSAIATDKFGNAYLAGYTQSANFPTRNAYQPNSGGGGQDAFVAKIGNSPDIAGPVLLPLLLGD